MSNPESATADPWILRVGLTVLAAVFAADEGEGKLVCQKFIISQAFPCRIGREEIDTALRMVQKFYGLFPVRPFF